MPASEPTVRAAAIQLIVQNEGRLSRPILEIGVGYGFYGQTLRGKFPNAEIYGVEVWPPYITPEHLKWYTAVILANASRVDYALFQAKGVSLIIAADVIEHFEKREAVALMEKWKRVAPWIVATLPIKRYEQGAFEGNTHEAHLHHWTVAEIERDLGLSMVADCGLCGLFQFYRERGERA